MFKINANLNTKFSKDLFANLISFACIAVSGLMVNVLIIKSFGYDILGGFNLVYSNYIVFSQLSVWGIHLSLQKLIPQFHDDQNYSNIIFSSGIFATFIVSSLVTIVLYLLLPLLVQIFASPYYSEGLVWVLPALIPFSLNKSHLAFLNGKREMIAYAIFSALRFFFFLIVIIYYCYVTPESLSLVKSFFVAEFALLVALNFYNFRNLRFTSAAKSIRLIKEHILFGNKAMVGHLVLDLNSKVDVLIMGLFLSDKMIGIYTFPAYLIDGISQIFYVLRTNINPILTKAYFKHDPRVLQKLVKGSMKTFFKMFALASILFLMMYPLIFVIIGFDETFVQSYSIYSILLLGLVSSSAFIPFQMVFNQIGFPGVQSMFLVTNFLINVGLNFLLVPLIGVYGAAFATALSFFLQFFLLKFYSSRFVKIELF